MQTSAGIVLVATNTVEVQDSSRDEPFNPVVIIGRRYGPFGHEEAGSDVSDLEALKLAFMDLHRAAVLSALRNHLNSLIRCSMQPKHAFHKMSHHHMDSAGLPDALPGMDDQGQFVQTTSSHENPAAGMLPFPMAAHDTVVAEGTENMAGGGHANHDLDREEGPWHHHEHGERRPWHHHAHPHGPGHHHMHHGEHGPCHHGHPHHPFWVHWWHHVHRWMPWHGHHHGEWHHWPHHHHHGHDEYKRGPVGDGKGDFPGFHDKHHREHARVEGGSVLPFHDIFEAEEPGVGGNGWEDVDWSMRSADGSFNIGFFMFAILACACAWVWSSLLLYCIRACCGCEHRDDGFVALDSSDEEEDDEMTNYRAAVKGGIAVAAEHTKGAKNAQFVMLQYA